MTEEKIPFDVAVREVFVCDEDYFDEAFDDLKEEQTVRLQEALNVFHD